MYISEIRLRGGLLIAKNPFIEANTKANLIKPISIIEQEQAQNVKSGLVVLAIGDNVPEDIRVGDIILLEPGAQYIALTVEDFPEDGGALLISEGFVYATLPIEIVRERTETEKLPFKAGNLIPPPDNKVKSILSSN